jgi:hypothetical protein
MTKKAPTMLLASLAAAAAVPLTFASVAQAEVCGDVGGRHVEVGGCTPGIVGGLADAAVAGAAVDAIAHPWDPYAAYPPPPPPAAWPPLPPGYLPEPTFPGQPVCYMVSGQPYFTPGNVPCYPL